MRKWWVMAPAVMTSFDISVAQETILLFKATTYTTSINIWRNWPEAEFLLPWYFYLCVCVCRSRLQCCWCWGAETDACLLTRGWSSIKHWKAELYLSGMSSRLITAISRTVSYFCPSLCLSPQIVVVSRRWTFSVQSGHTGRLLPQHSAVAAAASLTAHGQNHILYATVYPILEKQIKACNKENCTSLFCCIDYYALQNVAQQL